MKRLALCIVLALTIGTQSANAQFFGGVVFDPSNFAKNSASLIQQIKQYAKMAAQLNKMRTQVQYTIRSYKQDIHNLRQLPNKDWGSIQKAQRNLQELSRQADNIAYMKQFIENRYTDLYDTQQRLQELRNNPKRYKVYQDQRREHMKNKANGVIAASDANLQLTKKSYEELQKIRQQENISELSPQQMRQINAKVSALSTQQLIELKRVVSRQAAFSARKYRMAQGTKADQRVRMGAYNRKFNQSSDDFMNNNAKENDEIVPDWATDGTGQ